MYSARQILTGCARTFSILRVKFFPFNFIVADISITRTRSSSSRNMDDDFKHIFEEFLSTDGPVAINFVLEHDPNPTTQEIKHFLRSGTGVIRKKLSEGYSRSKNAARMREKRKDPEYASARTSDEDYSGARSVRARRRTDYYEFRIDRCCLRGLL